MFILYECFKTSHNMLQAYCGSYIFHYIDVEGTVDH